MPIDRFVQAHDGTTPLQHREVFARFDKAIAEGRSSHHPTVASEVELAELMGADLKVVHAPKSANEPLVIRRKGDLLTAIGRDKDGKLHALDLGRFETRAEIERRAQQKNTDVAGLIVLEAAEKQAEIARAIQEDMTIELENRRRAGLPVSNAQELVARQKRIETRLRANPRGWW